MNKNKRIATIASFFGTTFMVLACVWISKATNNANYGWFLLFLMLSVESTAIQIIYKNK